MVSVEQPNGVGVFYVRPSRFAQSTEREAPNSFTREHDVPLPNRLGLVVRWMSQRPLDGRERAEDLSGVDLSNSGRNVLHLPPLLVQDHTVQGYRDILSAAGASCVNHSQPFSPRESSKSVASGPPQATWA